MIGRNVLANRRLCNKDISRDHDSTRGASCFCILHFRADLQVNTVSESQFSDHVKSQKMFVSKRMIDSISIEFF